MAVPGFSLCKLRELNGRRPTPDNHCGPAADSMTLRKEPSRKKEVLFFSLHLLFCPSPFLHMPQILLIYQLISSHPQLQTPRRLSDFMLAWRQQQLLLSSDHILPLRHEASSLATICLGQSSLYVSFHQKLPPIGRVLVHRPLGSRSS